MAHSCTIRSRLQVASGQAKRGLATKVRVAFIGRRCTMACESGSYVTISLSSQLNSWQPQIFIRCDTMNPNLGVQLTVLARCKCSIKAVYRLLMCCTLGYNLPMRTRSSLLHAGAAHTKSPLHIHLYLIKSMKRGYATP